MGNLAIVRVDSWGNNEKEALDYDEYLNMDITFIKEDIPGDPLILTTSKRTGYRGPNYGSRHNHNLWISRTASCYLKTQRVV